MYKFVLLSTLFAVAISAPAPGLLHGGYAIPAATSYSSRIDIHGKPIVTAYAAPVVTKTVVAPLAHHGSYGVHSTPLLTGYGYGLGHGYSGLGHGLGLGYGLGHSYGLGHGYGLGHHGYGLGHSGYGLGHSYFGHGW